MSALHTIFTATRVAELPMRWERINRYYQRKAEVQQKAQEQAVIEQKRAILQEFAKTGYVQAIGEKKDFIDRIPTMRNATVERVYGNVIQFKRLANATKTTLETHPELEDKMNATLTSAGSEIFNNGYISLKDYELLYQDYPEIREAYQKIAEDEAKEALGALGGVKKAYNNTCKATSSFFHGLWVAFNYFLYGLGIIAVGLVVLAMFK